MVKYTVCILSKENTLMPWSRFENVKATKQIPGLIITSHKYKPTTLILVIAELHACKQSPIAKKFGYEKFW